MSAETDAGVEAPVCQALRELGRFAAELTWESLPSQVQDRALLMLVDTLGVTLAGAATDELRALRHAWGPTSGTATVLGAVRTAAPDTAAWLNGAAACALELDEGNKHAQGHPAAHVLFAALAAAEGDDTPVAGAELLAAVVAGYEVAARFGRATQRRTDLHTHGHWGAAGAGAAAARLRGLPAEGVASAMDAATGLVYATPWDVVLAGSFVRNLWAAGANVSGLIGARLAAAGLAGVEGTPARTLGQVVGGLDPAQLTDGLGRRWEVTGGYVKQHAACSYTHPAADAVLSLRRDHGFDAGEVVGVSVDTHRLTMPLAPAQSHSRIAAMFSLPYVVAVALHDGRVDPASFSAARRADAAVLGLADRVLVRHDPDLDARLPAERTARVTVELADGRRLTAEQPNPIGDADFHPFGAAEIRDKLVALLGTEPATDVTRAVEALPTAADARCVVARLP